MVLWKECRTCKEMCSFCEFPSGDRYLYDLYRMDCAPDIITASVGTQLRVLSDLSIISGDVTFKDLLHILISTITQSARFS